MADALKGPTSEQHAGVAVPTSAISVSYMVVSYNETGPHIRHYAYQLLYKHHIVMTIIAKVAALLDPSPM